VIEFDPASIPINENQPVYDATCQGSEVVPRPGAFKCTFENGGVGDPCFVIKDNTLICGPNPVHASYQAVVTATEPLPEVRRARGEPFAFYLDLGANKPPCERRAETFTVDGHTVTHTCQAPGAWIVGELDTDQPMWVAQYITTDTQGSTITYGPEASDVVRAWVH
jgi:hypothetical protein